MTSTLSKAGRSTRTLVRLLAFRESLGQSYLARAPRLRWALVVPTMMNGNPLERTRAFNDRTVQDALERELITVGWAQVTVPYGYRQDGDSAELLSISLTQLAHDELALQRNRRAGTLDVLAGE